VVEKSFARLPVRVTSKENLRSAYSLRDEREDKVKYDEFIKEVQTRGHMESRQEAENATKATLATLAERLAGGEPKDLASQLPREIAEHLRYEGEQDPNPFSLDEFFERVNERDPGVDEPRAAYHARVVTSVLQDAVTQGEMDHIRSQLPVEYDPLFESSSQGETNV